MHTLSVFLRCAGLAVSLLLLPLGSLLMAVCQTSISQMVSLSILLSAFAMLLACVAFEKRSRLLSSVSVFLALPAIAIIAFVFWRAPDGKPKSLRVQHQFTKNDWAFQQYAPGNLVPEIDQFLLGFKLVPFTDPFFTMKQSRHLSELTGDLYRELESDPDFQALGSVMPQAYDELLGRAFDRGHYFLYVPTALDRTKPCTALVFMHGSGGNFKAYTWLLSRVADRFGMIVIAPSFGLGNWSEPESTRVAVEALDHAARSVAIDSQNVHLLGLSNGGLAVCQVGASSGSRFKSLVFLSPVFDRMALLTMDFQEHWKSKPILIITGKMDDRVPIDYVQGMADSIQSVGGITTMKAIDDADHFMLFSHRDIVLAEISQWLKQHSVQK